MTRFRPFLVPLAALLLAACGGGSKGSNDGSEVLATVGDRNITAAEFADAFHRTGRADVDTADTPEGRRAFLQDLINRELMELGAYEAYPEAPIQLQWRLKRLRDGRLKDEIRNSLVTRSFQITPAMKDQLYENLSRERHLLGMLILDDAEAQYVREQLDAGAEWGPLALDHSAQWSTPQEAGDLGWQSAGSLPWELDQEVWSVPVGTTVGPRKYPLGNYIIRVVEERPAKAPGTRQNLEALLDERLREPLHLNAQKAMLDSLEAVEQPYYPSDGMQLLQLKYYWEAQTENPLEYLDANRVRPTFTAEEETTIVVEFKEAPDWTAGEFADRLDWYAQGLWPRGQSMEQLRESMDLVVRDYLIQKVAEDAGLDKSPEFVDFISNREREMRVTYFYYNNIIAGIDPTPQDIDAYYTEHRERYRSPASYKVAVFTSEKPELISLIADEWRAGASFPDLRDKYEEKDPALKSMGESTWIYMGQDPVADNVVSTLEPGGVSAPDIQNGVASVYKLIARREPRIVNYSEAKERIDGDAKTWYQEQALKRFLDEATAKFGVTINEKALNSLDLSTAPAE